MCRVGIQIHRQCGHEGIRSRKKCPFPHIPLHKSTTRIFLPGRCRHCLTAVWRLAAREDIDFSERQLRHVKLCRPFIDFFYTMISSTDQYPPRMIGYLADISHTKDIDFLDQIRLLLHRDILYSDQACKNVLSMAAKQEPREFLGIIRLLVRDFVEVLMPDDVRAARL